MVLHLWVYFSFGKYCSSMGWLLPSRCPLPVACCCCGCRVAFSVELLILLDWKVRNTFWFTFECEVKMRLTMWTLNVCTRASALSTMWAPMSVGCIAIHSRTKPAETYPLRHAAARQLEIIIIQRPREANMRPRIYIEMCESINLYPRRSCCVCVCVCLVFAFKWVFTYFTDFNKNTNFETEISLRKIFVICILIGWSNVRVVSVCWFAALWLIPGACRHRPSPIASNQVKSRLISSTTAKWKTSINNCAARWIPTTGQNTHSIYSRAFWRAACRCSKRIMKNRLAIAGTH